MAVVINEFEAVAEDSGSGGQGGSKKQPAPPLTTNARAMRRMTQLAARQLRLKAH